MLELEIEIVKCFKVLVNTRVSRNKHQFGRNASNNNILVGCTRNNCTADICGESGLFFGITALADTQECL